MHDPEKSDSGIVATKPTNKAGRPVAEPVQPRPGTKGNADQQSTHRTQGRARVIQAPGGVRRAARAYPRAWAASGEPQGRGRKNGSPRSSITSMSIRSGLRSTP